MDQTLQKLADDLGLSVMSVSRALQGRGGVSETTRQRVQAAADAAGYQPNPLARALLTGRTDNVGIVATDFADHRTAALFGALELSLRQAGLQAHPRAYGGGDSAAPQFVSALAAQRVAGIIVVGGDRAVMYPFVESAFAVQIPTVYINVQGASPLTVQRLSTDEIITDGAETVAAATRHLLDLDRKKLLLVADGDGTAEARIIGQFTDARGSAEEQIGSRAFLLGIANTKHADAAITELIQTNRHSFDAIITTTDRLAAGAIRTCQRARLAIGRRFQDDVSVLCAADSPLCAALEPAITAYEIAVGEIARLCVERLTAHIKSPSRWSPERLAVASRIIQRESA